MRISWHQRRIAMPVSSVPLSETHIAGRPRRATMASSARQGRVSDQRQTLAGEVIDDREDAETPAIDQGIRHEVEGPALVRSLRDRQRRSCAKRPLATTAPANLQPFLAVQAAELLVVHGQAL